MGKINPHQKAYFRSPSRFNLVLAGRRGGKTYSMLERVLQRVHCSPPTSQCAYIGPTLTHAKELSWDFFLSRLLDMQWSFKPRIAERCFLLPEGRKLYVVGAEKIDRIRGKGFWHIAMDEIAYFTQPMNEIWKAVRPTLSDFRGKCDFGTTPDGKGSDAYEFFQKYKGRTNWGYHHWITLDNPHIDPQEIEDAKVDLDERAFRQEYMATWETYHALAYYNFSDATHIKQQPPINPEVPLHLCFDFNVNPTTLLLSQYDGYTMRYKKEYSFNDSSTDRTIDAFCQDYKDLNTKLLIKIRGDATGNSRKSNTGRSDYDYVKDKLNQYGFNYQIEIRGSNPAIIDRVKIVNGWLSPISGSHRIEIDPQCKELIRDMSGQKLDGRFPSDANNMGHKADALGYDVYWQYQNSQRKQQGTVLL